MGGGDLHRLSWTCYTVVDQLVGVMGVMGGGRVMGGGGEGTYIVSPGLDILP